MPDEPTSPQLFPDLLGDVQRVTLSVEGRQNNNSLPEAGEEGQQEGLEPEPAEPGLSPTRTLSPDGLLARNYEAMGLGRRSVLLRYYNDSKILSIYLNVMNVGQ